MKAHLQVNFTEEELRRIFEELRDS